MLRSVVTYSTWLVGVFFIIFLLSPNHAGFRAQILKDQRSQPVEVNFEMNSGFGTFQDIQVPVDEATGLRPDGSPPGPESQTHNGFPIQGSLGLAYQFGGGYFDAHLQYTKMWALAGSESAPSASFSRLAADTGVTLGLSGYSLAPFVSAHGGWQRSSFYNVSTGHYYDALLTRLGAGVETYDRFRLGAYYATAPWTSFNYDGGGGDDTGEIRDARTTLNQFGAELSFNVYKRTWIDFGYEVERATIEIPNIESYQRVGLNILPSSNPSRVLETNTTLITAGFRKSL